MPSPASLRSGSRNRLASPAGPGVRVPVDDQAGKSLRVPTPEQVQAVLRGHRTSGERDRRHRHYLKGSVFCGACGRRLTYSRNTGNGGTYEYFVCSNNQRGHCAQGYQPVHLVEAAIERHYATVRLTDADAERVRKAVAARLETMAETAEQEIARCKGVLTQVKDQERKLLHMHYEERISGELFDEEQARPRRERQGAETLIARFSLQYEDIAATLELALGILSRDLQDVYARANDTIRRLLNQALFEALWVSDEEVVADQPAEPFASVQGFQAALEAEGGHRSRAAGLARGPGKTKAPAPWEGAKALVIGSINEEMVGSTGIEPVTSRV